MPQKKLVPCKNLQLVLGVHFSGLDPSKNVTKQVDYCFKKSVPEIFRQVRIPTYNAICKMHVPIHDPLLSAGSLTIRDRPDLTEYRGHHDTVMKLEFLIDSCEF